ncbi:M23 family metallopeptidase [Pontixanthobacter aestiaquae]|uniref:Peptidoglycan DD-metalloendopeptidase family protein n=2 Tax=Pontixanthobacter aestiaquae TaxID=1509367 RepID=A0A844Z618_9SPHN|nr:M23 family metallopeptidase [Pontixanthobacter aestiaquae]MDN3646757.1 M23 family metallopeptidase [Pontixanthobacter aestiaquae]MXO82260.1 peptidoglycan DD-metalloendopeptidase family protein [Pontixanthobacter aestiaquae]
MGASPALANTSAATAELPAPVRNADNSSITGSDENFKQLFAQWESLDGDDTTAPAPIAKVSIPSRMPLDHARLTSGYGMRTHPVLRQRRAHKGIDLAAPTGTPIYATADGIVSKAERFSSYGLYVSMEHGAGVQTRFAHMSRIAVADGQNVKKGDIIGYVGSTGRSTGPHLHYEVRIAGKAVNPIPYMSESKAQLAYAEATEEGGRGGQ